MTQWKRFLKTAAHRPSGLTVFDSFVQMAPFLTSRGTRELADHYRLLADETEDNVAQGIFPVPNEKYRLLWDNIAPWHQLRKCRPAWPDSMPISSLLLIPIAWGVWKAKLTCMPMTAAIRYGYLARTQNFSVCPHGLELRYRSMQKAIEEVGIDGVVFASNRSCKVYSIMQMDMLKRITRDLDIPAVMIDVDHADVRKYTEESVFSRIEALLELIDVKRNHALS